MTAAKMGAQALRWPPLLLVLLTVLLGHSPGATAQTQVCSVDKTSLQVQENANITEALVNISVPEGQQVTLGSSSTPSAFRILGNQLFLSVIPDYEENRMLEAHLECKRGDTVVTQLKVFVVVLDINDNAPEFPFSTKEQDVQEDTKVNSTVIPEAELQATDRDKDSTLFYTLQEVTPGAGSFFSLLGVNRPALRLDRALDFYKWQNMTFRLLVRDTREEHREPSHTATATLVLKVLPADLRPPWFLPCSYSDGSVCIQAQYQGAIPTGHTLLSPLILRPGPIYAVDGDRGINERVIYSIIGGNKDNTFAIDPDSGNLTMTKSVPSPATFLLLVKGEQADGARYSVTQVTVEARQANGSQPHFSQSLYRGTVAPGSGSGVAVQDAASPSQPLRIWAQDPEFPDLNSAITYQITNCSEFRMAGEMVLTATAIEQAGVFYAEVEANNTVTAGVATTVVEIRVSEPEPPSTGTTLRPPTSPTPGGPPSLGVGTSTRPATPGGGSAQTQKPGTSGPTAPGTGAGTSPQPATPGGGSAQTSKPTTTPDVGASPSRPATPGGGSAQTQKPGTSRPLVPGPSRSPPPSGMPGSSTGGSVPIQDDQHFSIVDMAVLGGVLGALLLLALLGLAILIHKHYGHQLNCCSGKAAEPQPHGFDNQAFLGDQEANWAPAPSPGSGPKSVEVPPEPPSPGSPAPEPPSTESRDPGPLASAPESPVAARAVDSPSAVRSILTKERRPEGGYKAVWFGEDIGAEADVVVLNAPTADADGAGDSGSEDSGEEDAGQGWGPRGAPAPEDDSTYI
ncbi:cadherin-related family member 5 isoform X2 [Marmota marmota marmota]|uniref:cadherin-related family member 5 isoform X2 n=1 Tax=Marmota marmota marmota TaxID=9994 RepID=UPI002092E67B|nr:cadherin-related family member 5 isoform X2 [Marmota marmota marmota]